MGIPEDSAGVAAPVNSGGFAAVTAVCAGLAALVAAIYAQTAHFDFVIHDDNDYVYENRHVLDGLTADNVAWALTARHGSNWHPLTFLSHMLDAELFKEWPGGHHLTNAALHALTAMLLFLALRRLTGSLARSAAVAALFAVHPLRVESVAWVSERKDVLSGFFFALTLLAYAGYARRPSLLRYLTVALPFTLGLLAKPMLVTVPFVLLLLDYWPLGRFGAGPQPTRRLFWEKAPLLALAAASSAVTVWAQGEAIQPFERISLWARTANALVSSVVYLRQLFLPMDLVVVYPHSPVALPAWQVVGAFAILFAMTLGALDRRQRRPYLLVGWLWFLGMLVPVIGLVQVGSQAHADRYTYLPQLGLLIGLVWWAADLAGGWRHGHRLLAAAAVMAIGALAWRAHEQTKYWRDSEALFTHALACTTHNALAHNNLGYVLEKRGKLLEAAGHFERAATFWPNSKLTVYNYGHALNRLGRFEDAALYLHRAVEIDPSNRSAWIELGDSLRQWGRPVDLDEAEGCLRRALELGPPSARAHNVLGVVLVRKGERADAISHFERAVSLEPGDASARLNLGRVLNQAGRPAQALAELREALRLHPDDVEILRLAAWVAATSLDATARCAADAVAWSERAVRQTEGRDPSLLAIRAAAYAEAGRFAEAIASAQAAFDLAEAQRIFNLAEQLRVHLARYRSGLKLRVSPSEPD